MTEHDSVDVYDLRSRVDRLEKRLTQLVAVERLIAALLGLLLIPATGGLLAMWKNDSVQELRIGVIESSIKATTERTMLRYDQIDNKLDTIKSSVVDVKERVIRLESHP